MSDLSRRTLLKSSLGVTASLAGLGGLAGCGEDSADAGRSLFPGEPDPPDLSAPTETPPTEIPNPERFFGADLPFPRAHSRHASQLPGHLRARRGAAVGEPLAGQPAGLSVSHRHQPERRRLQRRGAGQLLQPDSALRARRPASAGAGNEVHRTAQSGGRPGRAVDSRQSGSVQPVQPAGQPERQDSRPISRPRTTCRLQEPRSRPRWTAS
jgi:hypothetical protein